MARPDTTVWERLHLLFIHSEAGFDRPSLWQRESLWPGEVRVCGYLQLPYFLLEEFPHRKVLSLLDYRLYCCLFKK